MSQSIDSEPEGGAEVEGRAELEGGAKLESEAELESRAELGIGAELKGEVSQSKKTKKQRPVEVLQQRLTEHHNTNLDIIGIVKKDMEKALYIVQDEVFERRMNQVLRNVRVLWRRMINQQKNHLALIRNLGVTEDLGDHTNDNDYEDSWNKDDSEAEGNLDPDNDSFWNDNGSNQGQKGSHIDTEYIDSTNLNVREGSGWMKSLSKENLEIIIQKRTFKILRSYGLC